MSFIYKSNSSQHVQVIELGYADVKRLEANNSKQPNTEDYGGKFRTSFDKSSDLYHCLLTNIENTATYSMQRYSDEAVADAMTQLFTDKLTPFVEVSGFFNVNILSKVADVCCQHPYWSCAHVALEAQFTDAFTFEPVKREINSTSCERQQTPLHIVMGDNNTTLIKLLLNCGASPDVGDEKGNTPLHYATEPHFNYLIPDLMMASENKNPQNAIFETPINVASRKGNIEGVIAFHKHGGSFAIPDKYTYPILHAYEDENYEMAELILKLDSCEGRRQSPTGQTPLHLATSEAQLDLICQASHYLNAQDNDGDTALHLTVKAGELDMAVNLLAKAANPDIANEKGDSPLHTAAELNNVSMVQAMIVFGANIESKNAENATARHVAANHEESASAVIRALHKVGAKRCDEGKSGCRAGCKFDGQYNGDVLANVFDTTAEINKVYDGVFEGLISALSQPWSDCDFSNGTERRRKDAMLTLDGGGMRGIIMCQIISAIQNAADRRIIDCFDWIAGSSTGALTAAMLCTGHNVDDCMRRFFYMKDKVFSGPRPFDNENFEKLSKETFPEHIKVADVKGPKLIITSTLSNRIPAALHCFRNYRPPATSSSRIEAYTGDFDNGPKDYNVVKLWEAVRSSVAAPSYFLPYRSYLDGGLICNNPTVDALTEATEYYAERKKLNLPCREIGLVVSIGTGASPVVKVNDITMYVPSGLTGIYEALKNARGSANVGNLIMTQVTESRFRPVDRSRAWCVAMGAAFYRFSPPLSTDIDLAETDNVVIMQMMWDGHAYLHKHKDRINQLGVLLNLL